MLGGLRCAVPHDFLVAGAGDIYVAGGGKTLAQQFLHRFEDRTQRAFGIHRAAAPDAPFRYLAGERRVFPFAGGLNDVLMGHQQHGMVVGLSRPAVQQRTVNFGFFQLFMDQREQLCQNGVEVVKFRQVGCAAQTDGFALDHPRKVADIFVPLRFGKGDRRFGGGTGAAADCQGVNYGDEQQEDHQPQQAEQKV